MATSRKGLDKKVEKKAQSVSVDSSIEPGYVYVVDYTVNDLISGVTSYATNYHEMVINSIKSKFNKVKIEKIEIKNPRSPSKQYEK